MQELLDIHGQHETQSLLKQKYHLQLLDDYAGEQYSDLYHNITRSLININLNAKNSKN